jgi:hypothetical protein
MGNIEGSGPADYWKELEEGDEGFQQLLLDQLRIIFVRKFGYMNPEIRGKIFNDTITTDRVIAFAKEESSKPGRARLEFTPQEIEQAKRKAIEALQKIE